MRMGRTEDALDISSRVFLSRNRGKPIQDPAQVRPLWDLAFLYIENARYGTAREITELLLRTITERPDRYERQMLIQTLSLGAELDSIEGKHFIELEKRKLVFDNLNVAYGRNSLDTQIEATNYALALRRVGRVVEGCELLASIYDQIRSTNPDDVWSIEFARSGHLRCQIEGAPEYAIDDILSSIRDSWTRIAEHAGSTSTEALAALGSYANACLSTSRLAEAKGALIRFVQLIELTRQGSVEGSMARREAFSKWVVAEQGESSPESGYRQLAFLHAKDAELDSALRVSELARDRGLGDHFTEQEWRRRYLPAAEREQLDALIDRIQDYDERIAVTPEIIARIGMESERTLAVNKRGRLERKFRENLHLPEPEFHPPTLDELRARLRSDSALISVVHSGESWWALVVRRGTPARFISFSDPDMGHIAAAWVKQLRGEPVRAWPLDDGRLAMQLTRPEHATGPFLTIDDLGRRLSRTLLEPLEAALGGVRHLVFVGDDELVGVPLQALPRGDGIVLDRFEITYAPSLATYARWQSLHNAPAHARDLLAIGAVEFPRVSPPLTDDPILVGMQFASESPLPFARRELRAIAALFPAKRTTSWTGLDANKVNLRRASRSGELSRYRFVHFATHAWVQPDQPEGSAIALSSSSAALPSQGALTATELAGLRMGSDLIVLSACDTGLGPFEHGRGLLGLAYASLAAGNRAALLSLWPVADDTTAKFMQLLYVRMRQGQAPPVALAQTQREFRRSADPRLSNPLVWAPFVLYGGY